MLRGLAQARVRADGRGWLCTGFPMKGPYADPVMEEGCVKPPGGCSGRASTGPSGAPSGASRFSGAGLLAAKRRRGRCRAECGQALAAVHTSGEAGIAGWGFLFLVSGSFNVDKAFHNRAVFRLWKGVLACSCSRVSDWLVGLVWRAVDLEEPRCCGPFARLLESRAKGLRALAYWPRRPLRAAGADTLLSRFGV